VRPVPFAAGASMRCLGGSAHIQRGAGASRAAFWPRSACAFPRAMLLSCGGIRKVDGCWLHALWGAGRVSREWASPQRSNEGCEDRKHLPDL